MHIIFPPFHSSSSFFRRKTWPQSTRALSRSLGSPPWRWSLALAEGRWRCQSALACLGEALSGCWRGEGSSMCWPVHGCGHSSVLYRACGVRLLCSPPPPPFSLSQTSLGNTTVKLVFRSCF